MVMIQLVIEGLERPLDIGEVNDPPGTLVDRPADMNVHSERVPMQTCTLVVLWHIRQTVRRLDRKGLEHFHSAPFRYRMPRNLCVCRLNLHRGRSKQY